ncbi:uncharacterized protein RJT21DRAFT_116136 [Scheffersomyces amazonensis]|uniref:uncharacterized protein n=1 Tax=Scheffersomyces amazonensis TaxID=1078765 RepID=UPI00315DC504
MTNTLKSIINFDAVNRSLFPKLQQPQIDIFMVHRQGVDDYRKAQRELERYTLNPDEIKQLLGKIGLAEQIDYKDKEALALLLRLHNFHLLDPINVNPQILKIFEVFKHYLSVKFQDIKVSKYCHLTTAISINAPPVQFGSYVVGQSKSESVNSSVPNPTQASSKSFKPSTSIRNHRLNPVIDLFRPKPESSSRVNFELLTAKINSDDISEFFDALGGIKFETETHLESATQQSFHNNILTHCVNALKLNFEKVNDESQVANDTIREDKPIRITTDIMVKLNNIKIPIEIKRDLSPFKYLINNPNVSHGREVVHIFSQCLRESIAVDSNLVVLSDYFNTYLIDLKNAKLFGDITTDNSDLIRNMTCQIIDISDTSEFSTTTQLYGCLIHYYNQQVNDSNNLKQHIEDQNLKVLFPLINKEVINYNISVAKYCSDNHITSKITYEDTPTAPNSSEGIITEIANTTQLEITHSRTSILQKSELKSTSLEDLRAEYEFLEVISGKALQRNYSVVIRVYDPEAKTEKIIKIYDCFWNCKYQQKQDIKYCYLEALKSFSKELSSYRSLKGIPGIPTLHEAGFLNTCGQNQDTEFDIDKGVLSGFYLIIDLIPGKPLRSYPKAERKKFKECCQATIDAVHAQGIVHNDIHSGNIIICENEDGSFSAFLIDFGYSEQAYERKRWNGEPNGFSNVPKRDKNLDSRIQYDNEDLNASLQEDQIAESNKMITFHSLDALPRNN